MSSIGKKQFVAITGLTLILFILGHLVGNFFIYFGPEAYNNYAKKLASLRPGLLFIEFVLLAFFLIHIYVTALLVLENIKARPIRYHVYRSSQERSLATRLMPYTGTFIFIFVVWHILDFTFIDHHGPRSVLPDGKSYGLYGVVYNAFADPFHSAFYIVAMLCLGFHLSHGIQSFCQTLGFFSPQYTPLIRTISNISGILVTLAYSSIPVYVFLNYCSHFRTFCHV